MSPKILFATFLGSIIAIAASNTALARCGAKTCSEAYRACTVVHCNEERRQNCQSFCQPEYERCLQTGEFHGRQCQKTGLIKK